MISKLIAILSNVGLSDIAGLETLIDNDINLDELLSELEATQTLKEKISKLNPNMCDDGYSDGYYAAINAVEKILNGGE